MAKKQTSKRGGTGIATDDADDNVDKIRDILFGGQMRDYEKRLDAMEKRFEQAVERSARDLERRIERLDKYAKREVEKIAEQIRAERKDRIAEARKGTGEINSLTEQVETWFAESDEQLATESKDLRSALHEQVDNLTAQIRDMHGQLQATLQKETTELQDTKLASEDLAALLTEVAMRLNKDFKLPKG